MELQIQDLVSSIKHDGIEEAEKQKAAIISAAEQQSVRIVEDARMEATKLIDAAHRELGLERESSIAATKQACRDVVISLKKEISDILCSLLAQEVGSTLDSKTMGSIVIAALQGDDPAKYELVSKQIDAELKNALAKQIEKGLKLTSLPGFDGTRLSCKDGSGFYDFSDEEIAAVLKPFIGNLNV